MAHNVKHYSTPNFSIELGAYDGASGQGYYLLNVPQDIKSEDIATHLYQLGKARDRLHPELSRDLSFSFGSLVPLRGSKLQQLALKFRFNSVENMGDERRKKLVEAIGTEAGLTSATRETSWQDLFHREDETTTHSAAARF